MIVTEEAGKDSGDGRIKCHWVVLYKTLIEKYFCSV